MSSESLVVSSSPVPPPLPAALQAPEPVDLDQFLAIEPSRVTFREYMLYTWNPLQLLVAGLAKLMSLPFSSSADDPCVRSLAPFVVEFEELPPVIQEGFAVGLSELAGLGFRGPRICHLINDPVHATRTYLVSVASSDGAVIARLHNRTWSRNIPPKVVQFFEFLTPFSDGTWLWSLGSKPDMLAPPTSQIVRKIGATPTELLAAHRAAIKARMSPARAVLVGTPEQLEASLETHHATVRDFHTARRVFRPLTPEEVSRFYLHKVVRESSDASVAQHADVMVELDKLQNKKASVASGFALLVISIILFIVAGRGTGGAGKTDASQSWEFVLMLVPILLIHELGHLLAMKAFGYRNLRMFFIPFLGAAVSGKSYNVAAWKKVVVALAGPLPGIVLGGVVGIVGVVTHHELLVRAGILSLILNGSNLLPVFPLDGGRVLHGLLFSRHPLLDTGFRIVAAIVLVSGSLLLKTQPLMYVGIAMVIGLPVSFRLARIAADLRRAGYQPASTDSQTIPVSAAVPIIERVRLNFKKKQTSRTVAQHTLNVFEAVNTTPPGWPVTFLLGFVHVGSFLLAVMLVIGLMVTQRGNLRNFFQAAVASPKHALVINDVASAGVGPAPFDVNASDPDHAQRRPVTRRFVSGAFKTTADAQLAYAALKPTLGKDEGLARVGHVLIASVLPDDDSRRRWIDAFESRSAEVAVNDNSGPGMNLQCLAPSAESAEKLVKAINDQAVLWNYSVIAPWDPTDSRSPAEIARHERARQTLIKLFNAGFGLGENSDPDSPEGKAAEERSKRIQKARLRGEKEEIKRLMKEMTDEQTVRRNVGLLAVRNDPTSDRAVADLYISKYSKSPYDGFSDYADDAIEADLAVGTSSPTTQPADSFETKARERQKAFEAFQRSMRLDFGPLLGQCPLDPQGKPTPESMKFSIASTTAVQTSLIVQCFYLQFSDPVHGPEAFLKWLESKHCVDFKYDFTNFESSFRD